MKGRQPYVLTALRRKYAELLGLHDARADQIGAAILIFDPGADLSAIKPVRPYKAERERWMTSVSTSCTSSAAP